jgi:hypothetical protein
VDQTITPMEEFAADLDCIVDEAIESEVSFMEIIGALTFKAQAMGLTALGLFDDADSEDDEEEEV